MSGEYARTRYIRQTTERLRLRAIVDPWCRRTGTPLVTVSQFLFGEGRGFEKTTRPLGPDDEARLRAMIADHPHGLNPRAVARSTPMFRRKISHEAERDRRRNDWLVGSVVLHG